MSELGRTLLIMAMPAAGALIGGVLAEVLEVSRRTLSLVLHGVAGMLLGVIGIELMPRALKGESPWLIILLFGAGGLFITGVDWVTNLARTVGSEDPEEAESAGDEGAGSREQKSGGGESKRRSAGRGAASGAAWVIFIGVAVDFVTDGLMMVSGSTVSQGLGFLLGVALVAADTPEAFSTIATMKRSGSPRRTRYLLIASFPVTLIGGALLGHWLLRGAPEMVRLGVLSFTAGVILTLVTEEILPQSHDKWEGRFASLALIGGFMLFAFLSVYLGQGG